MNFTFETQGTNTYLVYKVGEDEVIDTMTLGMISNNKIAGLAPVIYTQIDTDKYIKFNVSAKISVSQFFSGFVNKKRLIGVFDGIVSAMLSSEDYMIDSESILIDLDYIYTDVSTCETNLICLPIVKDTFEQPVDLGAFFKNIMFSTQFDQTENCDYVAKIINYLNSSPVFSLADFKAVIDAIKGQPTAQPMAQPIAQPVAQPLAQPIAQPIAQPVAQPIAQPVAPKPVAQPVTPKPVAPQPVAQPMTQPAATMAIPNVPDAKKKEDKKAKKQKEAKAQPTGEKKIGMFDLLMHYSKENVELYKAQKAAEKEGTMATAQPVAQQAPKKTPGFSVPGKSNAAPANNFAVPGQQPAMPKPVQQPMATPVQQPVGSNSFAIPGQQPAMPKPMQQPATPVQQPAAPVQQPVSQPIMTQAPAAPQAQAMNFGETTVLSSVGMGETTVLSAVSPEKPQLSPHLIRIKNNERIPLNKPVFRIGKEKSYVDYFVGDNSAISRSHANIISRDEEFFVVDTNSTNHTYVNGNMIQSNIEVKLSNSDKIKLGNEEFEFKLI